MLPEMVNNGVDLLPEGCIAHVVSLTSPRDACRLSSVGSTFRSAAESDAVWEGFLPSDYKDIVAAAAVAVADRPPSLPPPFATKKQLYLWLADHPLVIDNGTKSFSLEKQSGRRCYMLAARDLSIVWGDTPRYWRWISIPESRFSEVAELVNVCWLEIRGKINTSMLSPNTTYAAFLVFKPTGGAYGFENQPAEVSVGTSGGEKVTQAVYLDTEEGGQTQRFTFNRRQVGMFGAHSFHNIFRPREPELRERAREGVKFPKARGDGWMEVELGEYFNRGGDEDDDRELEMSVMEVEGGDWKSGLIVQGIDIRPKQQDK